MTTGVIRKTKDTTEFAIGPNKSNWAAIFSWELLKSNSVIGGCIQLQAVITCLWGKCEGLVPGPLLFSAQQILKNQFEWKCFVVPSLFEQVHTGADCLSSAG